MKPVRSRNLALGCIGIGLALLSLQLTWAQQRRTAPKPRTQQLEVDPAYAAEELPVQPGTPTPHAGGVESSIDVPDDVDSLRAGNERLVDILVFMDERLDRTAAERGKVKDLCRRCGAKVRYEYTTVMPNVLAVRDVPQRELAAFRKLPGVVRVDMDQYHPNLVKLDESTPLVNGLQSQLSGAGLPYDGTGIRVCVADTGIDMDHIMYSSRIDTAASFDFANNDSNPDDDNGHGAHVAGIAVGGTGLTVDLGCDGPEDFQGMAPGATLIGAKILNSFGGGSDSDIIAGIDHCADQSPSGGRADVINLSIGTGNFSSGSCTHSWAVASNNAVANGVVVVAASGNENNSNSMGSPACGVDVIAVGATYKDDYPNCEDGTSNFNWGVCSDNSPSRDQIVCFSNESDHLDVSAPGSVIQSASNAAGGSSITGQSGTSMASPMVAGLAALILDADGGLTPAEVRQIIRDGAIDLGPTGFDRAYGWGRIDAINTLSLVTPCSTNGDCDDSDPCTTDVCNSGSCSNTPISCGAGQVCVGGTCVGEGACCQGQSCSIETTTACSGLSGTYLGDGTDCGSGTAGSPTTYSSSPNVAIPDGGGAGNPATDTITVGDSFTIGDLNFEMSMTHTWVGDVTVTLSHGGTTITVIDRPGVPASTYGCSADNYSGLVLDDEGTGGAMETACAANLGSPPNYTPTDALSAFDGMDASGDWIITLYDSATPDPGTLTTWSLHIDAVGNNPCDAGCVTDGDCDDGVYCNGAETCSAGTCFAGTPVNCDDGVACTDDACNESTDSCDNTTNDGNCDDGAFCNGAETCHATLGCQAGSAVNCDDGVGCTADSCNESTDSCDNTPDNGSCDDGLFCNGAETCHATLDCQAGSAVSCDDGVGCTDDSCDESTDSCDNTANDGNCDDGAFCNGVETCHATLDCQAGSAVNCDDGVGCTDDSCNESTDSCDNTANDGNCDDGAFCNGAETCHATLDCQAGSAVDCDDGVGCTDDSCNESTDSCDNVANDGNCDDGAFCNGAETCSATLDCQAGSAVSCDDGVGCTDDSCNESTDSCDNVANDVNCDDGIFCNGAETCSATQDCQAGSDPCPGQSCDEVIDACVGCTTDGDCDDGLFCNGSETCSAGVCQPGTAVDCDDGVGCTDDSCNESTESCDNVANDGNCDDGAFCNGAETCSATLDCQAGNAVNCDDGVGCTDDSCNESTDSCDNTANDGNCDDGAFCNGAETCSATLDCQAGSAVNCDDGVGCTDDSCNESTDSCDHTANDGNCDDGVFCNGVETCSATQDCQAGSDPCPGQSCDEGGAACVDCLTNGDCDDGLFCNGSESCSAGVCQAGSAVNCDDGVGCTDDSCNESTDSCDNVANDGNCDDGLFCNGAETCSATLDCQAGTDPCGGGLCEESTDSCTGGGSAILYMSFRSNTSVPGVGTVRDEDIVSYDPIADSWALYFDGSDVGLGSLEIDGLALLDDGDILLSFTAAGTVGGLATDDSDIVRFTPTSLGSTTAGSFSWYFDGSDVGLSTNGEDVSGLFIASDGRLVITTLGRISANGASGADEDMWIFNAITLGSSTSGSFERLFDGSDVGLNNSGGEDLDAITETALGDILFSTVGSFSVTGAAGEDEDIVEFVPSTLGNSTSGSFTLLHDLSALGIEAGEDIGSLHIDD